MRYTYCPDCGTKLTGKVAGDDGLVPWCGNCSKYWFDSFASCVIILVANDEDEIALLSQGYLSHQYMSFVSGYITPGETAEECAAREVKEELGIDLEGLEYAGTYWFSPREQLMHGFIGRAKKQDFKLSGEVDKAIWVKDDSILDLIFPDLPGNAMHPMYRLYLERKGK